MTHYWHTPLPAYFDLTADNVESRLAALDAAITGLSTGTTARGLNLGEAVPLTISAGAVTRTAPRHTIGSASSTDNLTTINGGVTGYVIVISATDTSHVITVKHGTGNIYLADKVNRVMDDTDKQIALLYTGSRWEELNGPHTTALTQPTAAPYRRPAGMPMMMTSAARNSLGYRVSGAAAFSFWGISGMSTGGTMSVSNQTDSTYINIQSGAVAGNPAGSYSLTYDLFRRSHNPKYACVFQLVDIVAVRGWFGFTSATIGGLDAVGGVTEVAAFRFSTVAGDAGFIPVTKNSTTQTNGAAMNTIAANTRYLLEVELDNANSRAIFTINNGTPVIVSATLPAAATDLGFASIMYTAAATAKNALYSRLFVEYD